ncbi:MAG: hypothetical protein F2774_03975 [Actinobacteria bacterium]|uniref:Unannotated protein n=1 Tax=freshwater metagenome TaxID=449393 RepID=A0A6J7BWA8_9ZZZZ|nr:hypothetical protein [Actinomycetota bacterium]
MNYTQLVSEIQNYTENEFTTEVVNTFITQAEQRIYNSVQLPALRKNVTGTTTAGNKYLAMPDNWLATFSLAIINAANEYTYLLNKDVNFIRQSYPDTDSDFYGEPAYYAVFDNVSFIMGPTPDDSYDVELHYFYYPESITTTQSGTTWLGDNFSSTLLYGSLLEAYTYMKGEADVMAQYQKRYDDAMVLLKQLGDGKDRQDAYRSGQVRYPVR